MSLVTTENRNTPMLSNAFMNDPFFLISLTDTE